MLSLCRPAFAATNMTLRGVAGVTLLLASCGGVTAVPGASSTGPAATTSTTTPAAQPTVSPSTAAVSPPAATGTTTAATTLLSTTTIAPEPTWRYVFPVQPADLATYGADHHDYPATDIFAPIGTLVVAVTDGTIDELSRDDLWDPGIDDPATRGGRFVSIIGDDGLRYYCSHLESVAEGLDAGDRVAAGDDIGTVGTSGNAAETSPHCHFGISAPSFPGDWETRRGVVWPYGLLQAWEHGQQATPALP